MGTIVQMICKCLTVTSLTYISSSSCSFSHTAALCLQTSRASQACLATPKPAHADKVFNTCLIRVTAQRHASLPGQFVILEMTRHGFCTTNCHDPFPAFISFFCCLFQEMPSASFSALYVGFGLNVKSIKQRFGLGLKSGSL